jgi:hypothetical protein
MASRTSNSHVGKSSCRLEGLRWHEIFIEENIHSLVQNSYDNYSHTWQHWHTNSSVVGDQIRSSLVKRITHREAASEIPSIFLLPSSTTSQR